jgi:bifunctional enzyme CysN/CysC
MQAQVAEEARAVAHQALRERMNIVIVGHVDHGKSTVIGRLLTDTHSLPDGKLEQVKQLCRANAKPFEYAFLLDALKDEQAQGITIDAARCFFRTKQREYVVIDAPGHIEFLKNMVTGASRAEAALLVIDAKEGIQENSRRHGFLVSLLGIRQLVVLVNKMDLVGYSEAAFAHIEREFRAFLDELGVTPLAFVPISARDGKNLVERADEMRWYEGHSVLEHLERLNKEAPADAQPFRLPVQDIYKFTEHGDDRRIVAGTVRTGSTKIGDELVFVPSGKRARLRSIEGFNEHVRETIQTGQATGVTLGTQIYLRPGEIMCRADEPLPDVGSDFVASVFWLGKRPLVPNKRYKLKLQTASVSAYVRAINRVVDASDLSSEANRDHVERHEVAECVLQTVRPIAFETGGGELGRFVLVDDFEIAGGGIVTGMAPAHAELPVMGGARGAGRSLVTRGERQDRFRQDPQLVLLTGVRSRRLDSLGALVERRLFDAGRFVYFLGHQSLMDGLDADVRFQPLGRDEHLRRLGQLSRLFADAGCVLIAVVPDLDVAEFDALARLSAPTETLVVAIGEGSHAERAVLTADERQPDDETVEKIVALLHEQKVILDYQI